MPPSRAIIVSLACLSIACSGCARSETRVDGPAANHAASGSIAGGIHHPAHVIPSLRICAIGSGAPAKAARICIRTRHNQSTYRIDGLPPDDYIVIVEGGGGHLRPVQCIRAPCPKQPAAVTVAAGAHVDGIDLGDFHERRSDFPALPPE